MNENAATHGHLLLCECGHNIRVGRGQAGATLVCQACGKSQLLPNLSHLRRMPVEAGLAEDRGAFQFSLRTLFGLVLFFALATAAGKAVGFHWLFVMVPVCAAFGIAGAIAPRPVIYGTLLTCLLLLTATLVTRGTLLAREDARRNASMNNLKNLGLGWAAVRQYDSDARQDINAWAEEHGYDFNDSSTPR